MTQPKPTAHEVRRIAVAAIVDPRTVRTYLEGRPTRSTTAVRIAEALRALGLPAPQSTAATPATEVDR